MEILRDLLARAAILSKSVGDSNLLDRRQVTPSSTFSEMICWCFNRCGCKKCTYDEYNKWECYKCYCHPQPYEWMSPEDFF